MIKLVFCLRRKPGLSITEFQEYWRETHAPLVKQHRDVLGIRHYVQCHYVETSVNAAMSGPRQTREKAYDGVAELWFDSLEAMMRPGGPEAGKAAAALLEDEAKFIDLVNSPIFMADEYAVF